EKEITNPRRLASYLNTIGFTYWTKGEFDTALKYYHRQLAIYKSIGDSNSIAWSCFMIGTAYRHKGEIETALEYFHQNLTLSEASGNDVYASLSLAASILIFLDHQDLTQAQKYLIKLQKLERTPHPWISHQSRLTEALILKESKRMKDKTQAQTILQQLLKENNLMFVWARIAMVALCELLLVEVKSFGDPEAWGEAKSLIRQLHIKAQDNHSVSTIVETLLLRAKVATIEGDLPQALKYYDQARLTAEEKKLCLLIQKVNTEQNHFEAEFEEWQALIQRNASLQERLAQSQIDDYIQKVQKLITRMKD
ncbi:MAG: tetratricopeptide repeat protein, partial [Candidatus Hodarchaeota archaeon]